MSRAGEDTWGSAGPAGGRHQPSAVPCSPQDANRSKASLAKPGSLGSVAPGSLPSSPQLLLPAAGGGGAESRSGQGRARWGLCWPIQAYRDKSTGEVPPRNKALTREQHSSVLRTLPLQNLSLGRTGLLCRAELGCLALPFLPAAEHCLRTAARRSARKDMSSTHPSEQVFIFLLLTSVACCKNHPGVIFVWGK